MRWIPIKQEIQERVGKAILKWKGTPYRPNHQIPGVGVDCVRFVTGVLDELYGVKTEYTSLPSDTCLHDPDKAVRAMLAIARIYPHEERPDLHEIEPGDILVTGSRRGPGHAMIAGPRENHLWHHDGREVCFLSRLPRRGVYYPYKILKTNKENW